MVDGDPVDHFVEGWTQARAPLPIRTWPLVAGYDHGMAKCRRVLAVVAILGATVMVGSACGGSTMASSTSLTRPSRTTPSTTKPTTATTSPAVTAPPGTTPATTTVPIASASLPTLNVPRSPYNGIKPDYLVFSGDATNAIGGITWSSWTQTSALGQGTWDYLSCVPTCAGSTAVPYPATITLAEPAGGVFTVITETTQGPQGFTAIARFGNAGADLGTGTEYWPNYASGGQAVTAAAPECSPTLLLNAAEAQRLGVPLTWDNQFGCSGDYAWAAIDMAGATVAFVFAASGGTWVGVDRASLCQSGKVPQDINYLACEVS